ncbi:MAG TPA: protein-glutamate O-methyltransferase CheR [Vicinamibacterales bacterium]|nr:protein-glutamate O-methyltransferase CheR [Vicinamibacterales bacterium]
MAAVLAVVRRHLRASGVADEGAYFARLSEEPEGGPEWAALVEHLLNHETSFFRHPASFDALRTHVLPELRDTARGRRLNLWSAGCSTGQEAYSLAMVAQAAVERRELLGDFTVWGSDISRESIVAARRGRFNARAVAGIPGEYRERYLRPSGDGVAGEFEFVEPIRRRIRFTPVNLLTLDGLTLNYDVIFCHNVLIYFPPDVATQVVAALAQRLTLGGYLFLGPGESPSQKIAGVDAAAINGVRGFHRRIHRNGEVRS